MYMASIAAVLFDGADGFFIVFIGPFMAFVGAFIDFIAPFACLACVAFMGAMTQYVTRVRIYLGLSLKVETNVGVRCHVSVAAFSMQ